MSPNILDKSNQTSALKLPHLDNGDHYFEWKERMQDYLKSKGRKYWRILDGSYLRPVKDADISEVKYQDLLDDWEDVNDVVSGIIGSSCSGAPSTIVRKHELAKTRWDALQFAYQGRLSQRIDMLEAELGQLQQHSKNNGFDIFITQLENICDKLAAVNSPVSIEKKIRILLNGVRSDLSPQTSVISFERDKVLSEQSTLLDPLIQQANLQAFYDRSLNHLRIADEKLNFAMKSVEHTDKVLYNKSAGQYRQQNQQPRPANSNKGKPCFYCKKPGHVIADCRKRIYKERQTSQPSTENQVENKGNNVNSYIATDLIYSLGLSQKGVWIFDSGATGHASGQQEVFTLITFDSGNHLETANGDKIPIIGRGIVKLRCKIGKGSSNVIELHDVAFAPGLQVNLVSIDRFQARPGTNIQFNALGAIIRQQNGNIVCRGLRSGKSTILDGEVIPSEHSVHYDWVRLATQHSEHSERVLRTSEPDTSSDNSVANLWHNRLGHIGTSTLRTSAKTSIGLEALTSVNFDKLQQEVCSHCLTGKQTRLPFRSSTTKTSEPLELIHSDLVGKMKTPTFGGHYHLFVLIDDFTRVTWAMPIAKKSEVFELFKNWKAAVENGMKLKIQKLRTDNGGEYCNKMMKSYLYQEGIRHEMTNRYTPQQNGVAERSNYTLFNIIRSILLKAQCSSQLWGEAAIFACHLKNRLSSTATPGTTPYELWTKKKADVSNIRTFGCAAFAQVPQETRTKLDPRSTKLVYLGETPGIKGFRLLEPKTNDIIHSRDVIFDESSFPYSELANGPSEHSAEPLAETLEEDIPTSVGVSEQHRQHSEPHHAEEDPVEEPRHDLDNIQVNDGSHQIDDDLDNGPTQETIPGSSSDEEEEPSSQSRPTRNRVRPTYLDEYVQRVEVVKEIQKEPSNIKEAKASLKWKGWEQAIQKELNSHKVNRTWIIIDRPINANIIGSRWVFKEKLDNLLKAQLVAQGFGQIPGIDYEESQIFAPVVKFTTLRFIIAYASSRNWEVHQMDVVTAYLNGNINKEVFMEMPPGYTIPNKVCKLQKAIYGLKQAGRTWYQKADKFFHLLQFARFDSDHSLYTKDNKDGTKIIIAIYVDDIIITASSVAVINCIKQQLSTTFAMTDAGKLGRILGLQVSWETNFTKVSQSQYIDNILCQFNMKDCKTVRTPVNPSAEEPEGSPLLNQAEHSEYRSAVGALLYCSTATRPDISFAVQVLSRTLENPNQFNATQLRHLLRYMKGTIDYGLHYFANFQEGISAHSDSDHGGDKKTRRSTSGCLIRFNRSPIDWSAKRQPVIALSTTEAEYIAMTETSKSIIWLQSMSKAIGITGQLPTTLEVDNIGAKELAQDAKFHARTKHIDIRFHFIRECVANGQIQLKSIGTDDQLADGLTKGLGPHKIEILNQRLNLISTQK